MVKPNVHGGAPDCLTSFRYILRRGKDVAVGSAFAERAGGQTGRAACRSTYSLDGTPGAWTGVMVKRNTASLLLFPSRLATRLTMHFVSWP